MKNNCAEFLDTIISEKSNMGLILKTDVSPEAEPIFTEGVDPTNKAISIG